MEDGLEYEADQRHAEIIATETGMTEDSKEVVTPGVSVDDGKTLEKESTESCSER